MMSTMVAVKPMISMMVAMMVIMMVMRVMMIQQESKSDFKFDRD